MSIRTRVWYDMLHAKAGDEYLTLYLAREKKWRVWYKVGLIGVTTAGLYFSQTHPLVPVLSLTLVWVSQLVSQVQNFIVMSDDNFGKLGGLRMMYYERWAKLEDLWFEMFDERVNHDEAQIRYYETRKEARDIEKLDNSLLLKKRKILDDKAQIKTQAYIDQYHGYTEQPEEK